MNEGEQPANEAAGAKAKPRPSLIALHERRRKEEHRPWYRFHLSTLIVLVFAAGFLLFLNMHYIQNSPIYLMRNDYYRYDAGWPVATEHFRDRAGMLARSEINHGLAGALNTGVALAVLFILARICEWYIAWRTRKRPVWKRKESGERSANESS